MSVKDVLFINASKNTFARLSPILKDAFLIVRNNKRSPFFKIEKKNKVLEI